MNISIIAAIGQENQLGLNNQLLWKIPEDLAFFKKTTLGHYLIMGRKTYESIGRALPGRHTIILSRDPERIVIQSADRPHTTLCASLEEAFLYAQQNQQEKIFIAGGADLYHQALPYAHQMLLTRVDWNGSADTFFPQWNLEEWQLKTQSNIEQSRLGLNYVFEEWSKLWP